MNGLRNQRNPRSGSKHPTTDERLKELRPSEATRTLVEELGEVADDLRQLYTDFGARPYTVHAVRVTWSGGERGRGEPRLVFDQPLLPTPRVEDLSIVQLRLEGAGSLERGDIRLTEISPRYTEAEIRKYFSLDETKEEEGFIEIRMDDRDGTTQPKRYVVASVPARRAEKFDWTVILRKQDSNRLDPQHLREPRKTVARWRGTE